MLKRKIYPLYVPEGKYCYHNDFEETSEICPHLIQDSGFPSCLMDFDPEREGSSVNILKDPECLELEDYPE